MSEYEKRGNQEYKEKEEGDREEDGEDGVLFLTELPLEAAPWHVWRRSLPARPGDHSDHLEAVVGAVVDLNNGEVGSAWLEVQQ